ncbi:hypothetical protein JF535_09130 [Microbulbifer salipaludis]|uniref:DUF2059 domain-containing protein n=1 Tax=Microbulbifer salipaludis TaxID=187980 RepID=A0ABS3E7H4_9GAMM|nr:hypothetical protein [Microbulbifer salipaludis]MBN8431009.1 hypothetical protein [Microbulbifer salipaludis]
MDEIKLNFALSTSRQCPAGKFEDNLMQALLLIALLIISTSVMADDIDSIIEYSGIRETLAETNQAFLQDAYQDNPGLSEKSDLVERYFSENIELSNFRPELERLLKDNFSTAELRAISNALSGSEKKSDRFQFYGTELGQRWLTVDGQFSDIVLLGAAKKIMDPDNGLANFLHNN